MLRALHELILRIGTGLKVRLGIGRRAELDEKVPWLVISYSFEIDWFAHVNGDEIPRIVRRGIE